MMRKEARERSDRATDARRAAAAVAGLNICLRLRRAACGLAAASFLTAFIASPSLAGALSALGAGFTDSTGAPRSSFSNNETIGMQFRVNNALASTTGGRVQYKFEILGPGGNVVFTQIGNAVPGTVGNSQSSLSGVPTSAFYTTPGTYTLRASATLDGQTITQTVSASISSPNLILTYPPNGAQGVATPVTFQWSGSGAPTFQVTVGDNPSLFNSIFTQTVTGANTLTYPVNPPDPRQRMTVGQVYYWKVAALDSNGNVLAQSQPAYSFTIANTTLTRDLAVTALAVAGPSDPQGKIPFTVTVKNQGATTESNVPVQFSLGGLTASNSPGTIDSIAPGGSSALAFSAAIPPGQAQGMAVACLQFFDDVMANNCQTLSVAASAVTKAADAGGSGGAVQSPEQIWQEIQNLLKAQGISLDEYQLVGMEGQLTADQLAALLDALRQGQAQINLSGPPIGTPLPPPPPPNPVATTTPPPPDISVPPPAVAATSTAAAAGAAPAANAQEGAEFSGETAPSSAQTRTITVCNATEWQRLWGALSTDGAPPIDFGRNCVVGVILGRSGRGGEVQILDVQRITSGLQVRYTVTVEKGAGKGNPPAPYVFRVTSITNHDAVFVEVKEDSNGKP